MPLRSYHTFLPMVVVVVVRRQLFAAAVAVAASAVDVKVVDVWDDYDDDDYDVDALVLSVVRKGEVKRTRLTSCCWLYKQMQGAWWSPALETVAADAIETIFSFFVIIGRWQRQVDRAVGACSECTLAHTHTPRLTFRSNMQVSFRVDRGVFERTPLYCSLHSDVDSAASLPFLLLLLLWSAAAAAVCLFVQADNECLQNVSVSLFANEYATLNLSKRKRETCVPCQRGPEREWEWEKERKSGKKPGDQSAAIERSNERTNGGELGELSSELQWMRMRASECVYVSQWAGKSAPPNWTEGERTTAAGTSELLAAATATDQQTPLLEQNPRKRKRALVSLATVYRQRAVGEHYFFFFSFFFWLTSLSGNRENSSQSVTEWVSVPAHYWSSTLPNLYPPFI